MSSSIPFFSGHPGSFPGQTCVCVRVQGANQLAGLVQFGWTIKLRNRN